jgi:hypothetical protein
MFHRQRLELALAAALTLTTGVVASAGAGTSSSISASSPCGAAPSGTYSHVVWIMLENVGYSVIDSPSAPYLNGLARECGLATNYVAVSHPSLPNYIALTSGSTQGITDDGEPSEHPLRVPSIFSELGSDWRTYAESMPTSCGRVTTNVYAARHNPAVYYTNINATCTRQDVALSLPLNLSTAFTMIVPNICDDMHSCAISVGDAWLRKYVPLIVESSQYQDGSLALFITFDENDTQATNRVPTLVIAPSVPKGLRVDDSFTHYSLLRTTEVLLHVGYLGFSRSSNSMVSSFHL